MKLRFSSPKSLASKNSGFSLIEIAVVLTIVGLMMGATWIIASTVIYNNKENQLDREALQIIQNTRKFFGTSGGRGGNGLDTATAIQVGIFPAEMIVNGAAVDPFYRSPGDGFSNVSMGSTSPTSFVLVIGNHGIPYDACVSLVSQVATTSNFKSLGITNVFVGGGTGSPGNGSGNGVGAVASGFTTQPTVAQIAAACVADNLGSFTGGVFVQIFFNI